VTRRRYWFPEFEPDEGRSESSWLEALDAGLAESVRAHLVSDVPFGAFLSGGVDSSSVVAYMARILDRPVKTFTIAFDDDTVDESPFARQVARHLGTEHFELTVRPDAFSLLPELVRHYGEPFADSSAIPTWYVSKLAAEQVRMVLSGDGGDEMFAGYSTYSSLLRSHRKPEGVLARGRHAMANVLRRAGVKRALPRPVDTRYAWTSYFDDTMRRALWRTEHRGVVDVTRSWFDDAYTGGSSRDVVAEAQRFDARYYLVDDILAKVDIASMCHGLEVRVPLIDPVLFALLSRLPTRLKVQSTAAAVATAGTGQEWTSKYLLKRNAERLLPPEIVHRRKSGFSLPIDDWLRGPLRNDVEQRLADNSGPLAEVFSSAEVRRLVTAHTTGESHGWRLWSLLFLHEWFEQNRGLVGSI
jgi:asparagine synthase (glutamine-hydrolysing)